MPPNPKVGPRADRKALVYWEVRRCLSEGVAWNHDRSCQNTTGRVWLLTHGCSVPYLPGLSRDFDCFDFILEWDGMSGMEVVFDSLIFLAAF